MFYKRDKVWSLLWNWNIYVLHLFTLLWIWTFHMEMSTWSLLDFGCSDLILTWHKIKLHLKTQMSSCSESVGWMSWHTVYTISDCLKLLWRKIPDVLQKHETFIQSFLAHCPLLFLHKFIRKIGGYFCLIQAFRLWIFSRRKVNHFEVRVHQTRWFPCSCRLEWWPLIWKTKEKKHLSFW